MARPRVALASRPVPESPTEFTEKSLKLVRDLVAEAVAACCDLAALARGKVVLVKPNLVRPDPRNPCAVVTDERVLLSVVGLLRDAGAARVLVGDNPGYGLSLFEALACMADFTRRIAAAGGEIVSFDHCGSEAVPNPGAFVFDPVRLPRALLDADVLLDLPKMKTHVHTLVTLGVKNLYGLVCDEERMFCHRNDINAKVVDVLRLARPQLTVLDGLWAVQGQAPLSGSAVPDMNVIAAGTDVCAVDTVAADLMGIGAHEVAMLRLAKQEGLGETDLSAIEVVGADPAGLRRAFARPVIGCAGAYDAVCVHEGGACMGCLSALRHALDKLAGEGAFAGRKPVTLYVGVPMPERRSLLRRDGELWCFGACAAPLAYQTHGQAPAAHCVPGCPPHILDFYKAYKARYGNGAK